MGKVVVPIQDVADEFQGRTADIANEASLGLFRSPQQKRKKKNLRTTYLVLDEELDTLNGSSSGLRDGGGDTTHCRGVLAMYGLCCGFVRSYPALPARPSGIETRWSG